MKFPTPSGATRPALREDVQETHYEWLARMLAEGDRRKTPFEYRRYVAPSERRRWDAFASLAAARNLPTSNEV